MRKIPAQLSCELISKIFLNIKSHNKALSLIANFDEATTMEVYKVRLTVHFKPKQSEFRVSLPFAVSIWIWLILLLWRSTMSRCPTKRTKFTAKMCIWLVRRTIVGHCVYCTSNGERNGVVVPHSTECCTCTVQTVSGSSTCSEKFRWAAPESESNEVESVWYAFGAE